MTTFLTGSIIQCIAIMQNEDGNIVQNRYHFELSGDNAEGDDIATACATAMTAFYQYFDEDISNLYDALNLKIDQILWDGAKWVINENIYVGSWTAAPTFTSVGEPLPPGVSALGRLITGYGKHLGKKFIAGLTEAANGATGKLTSAVATKIINGLLNLFTTAVPNTVAGVLNLVVLDVTDGTVRLPIGASSTGTWSYQRRRRTGVGI